MGKYPVETRLKTQQAMNLALQTVIAYVFSELAKDPKLADAIKTGFDNAALSAEVLALKTGGTERGEAASDVLGIIEEFRKITFGEK